MRSGSYSDTGLGIGHGEKLGDVREVAVTCGKVGDIVYRLVKLDETLLATRSSAVEVRLSCGIRADHSRGTNNA
jgi:hypothetical protein